MTESLTAPGPVDDDTESLLSLPPDAPVDEVVEAVRVWIATAVPAAWVEAGRRGGPAAVREVRTRAEYEAWYPVFGQIRTGGRHLAARLRRARSLPGWQPDGSNRSSARSTSAA